MSRPVLLNAEHWLQGQTISSSVAVAWSGGIDSTALLLLLKQQGYQVVAWHVDHGWHETSKQHAFALEQQAKKWHIPFLKCHLTGITSRNKEAESRRLRYAQFSLWAKAQNIHTLAIAHHADDQAETICMRLLQGAGSRGCRGIARQREWSGLQLIRPLLHVDKQALRASLIEANVSWLEDKSNRDLSFLRNRIRHQLLPAIEQHHENAQQLFVRLGRQMQALNQQVEAQVQGIRFEVGAKQVSVSWQVWAELSSVVRADVLRRMFETLLGKGKTPGKRHFQLMEKWMIQGGKGGLDLSSSRLFHQGDDLCLKVADIRIRI